MHSGAIDEMMLMLQRAPENAVRVLDVGSYDVNGTYRSTIDSYGWEYTGLDLVAGPNVDIVALDPYAFPFKDCHFDIVISGSTMEHVERPWLWVPELARVLVPGGLLAILTHWQFPVHRFPIDTYRYLPDGMMVLFDEAKCLVDYDIRIVSDTDIIASAFKQD
jgi:SAM-dependent methyltransferase